MSDQDRIHSAYRHLLRAEAEHKSVNPLTEEFPDITVDEAYQVQMLTIGQRVKEGLPIVGKKIGLTSLAMQEMLGVDQPDYGHLLNSMQISNKGNILANRLFQPKAEAEIAFILNRDLKGPNVTLQDVLNATAYVVPALEIVDSRVKDWNIKLQDTIADNASSGLFVLGDERFSVDDIDLTKEEMKLYRNGEHMNTGYGSAVLGHPATCVAWLANKLYEYNVILKAGEVILSGALSAAVNVHQGDRVTAEFINLGQVEVVFS
ncbi:fumarylacetoacetate hydrolase family protein [Paenibacillus frigoriresistens]|uniref:2-keto-4-pentenoate hydratase n=1 Tax=Paenibacillus alginolyticus TaxID=59839 RepID=UPI0015670EAA|nr:2-keto-4-pentenoate hydratase [Paenibacillus frigoriresistens]NRF94385.1 fumarylacetoacetate hydrolase family protein [Paenibacillus frigoriresistens]